MAADGTQQLLQITVNGANDAAIIGGTATGSVTEDGTQIATGTLTINDLDDGESEFQPQTQVTTSYGTFWLEADGDWTYNLDNDNAAVQALNDGGTLTDTIQVLSTDGTSHNIAITIEGADEVVPGTLDIGDVTMDEGDSGTTNFTFTVTRSGGSDGAVGASWFMSVSSANAADFTAFPQTGTVSFADGETSRTITITVQGDTDLEGDNSFTVQLTDPTGGATIGDFQGLGIITNDDQPGQLDIGDATMAEGDSGTTNLTFTVTRSGGSDGAVSASWFMSVNDATAADFTFFPQTGTVNFAHGETSATITITVQGDTDYENDESFTVQLHDATGGATIGDFQGLGIITNDDALPPPTVDLDSATGGFDYTALFTENDPGIPIGFGIVVTSYNGMINGGTVSLDTGFAGDSLVFTGSALGGVIVNASSTQISFTGLATVAQYQAMLSQIRFVNNLETPVETARTISVTLFDNQALSNTALATINVDEINDLATITGQATGSLPEEGGTVTGTLNTADLDTNQDRVQAFSATGTYGGFSIAANGEWSYSGNYNNSLRDGETVTDTFTVTSADGTDTQDVVITIVGANDVPMVASFGNTAARTEDGGNYVADGGGSMFDDDHDESTWQTGTFATTYGTITITVDSMSPAVAYWNYTLNNAGAAVQGLRGGQVVVDQFNMLTFDGSNSIPILITITGVNDAATITGTDTGDVYEDGTLVASGTLVVGDVDTGEDELVPQNALGGNGYGTFVVNANGSWTYTLNNAHASVQALDDGQTLTDTITVVSEDGTDSEDITVTIHGLTEGANTPPVVNFSDNVTFVEDNPGNPGLSPIPLDANGDASVIDDSADFDTGTLTLSISSGGIPAEDVLFVRTTATVSVSGSDIVVDSVTIGTWAGGTSGNPFVVTFNANATPASVSELMKALVYDNTSQEPTQAARFYSLVVTDGDGGTSNTGTGRIDVFATNDAPTGTDKTIGFNEDTPYTFTAADFGFGDVDSDTLLSVIVTTLPGAGTLTLNGGAVTLGQEIAAGDIPLLVFTPAPDGNGMAYASFTFQVRDNGGTDNGSGAPFNGEDTDQSANTITFNVTAQNDAPVVNFSDNVTFVEDNPGNPGLSPIPLDANGDAAVLDIDSADFDTGTLTLSISSGGIPAEDVLFVRTTASVSVSGSDIVVNSVTIGTWAGGTSGNPFVVTFNANATPASVSELMKALVYDNTSQEPTQTARFYSLVVTDGDGGTSNTGTGRIDVFATNDAPTGTDNSFTVNEDTPHTFTAADFGFGDVDSDTLLSVIVTTLPGAGALTLNGGAVSAGQEIAAGDIPLLVFTPAPDANGVGYASFTFQVRDNGGTDNGSGAPFNGEDTDQSANTITFNVTAVNDAPTAANLSGDAATWTEGQALAALLDVGSNAVIADLDSANFDTGTLTVAITGGLVAAQDQLVIRLTGTVSFNATAVFVNGTQIATYAGAGAGGGPLVFTFDEDATPAAISELVRAIAYTNSNVDNPTAGPRTISWTFVDGDGQLNAGADTLSVTSSVDVVPVNDRPTIGLLANNTAQFTEGGAPVLLDLGSNATVTDADSADFGGGSLTVGITTGYLAGEDVLGLSASLQGTVALSNGANIGSEISIGGIVFGTVTASTADSITIAFDSDATPARVQELLRIFNYSNTNTVNPSTATRIVTWTLIDGDGIANGGADTRTITSFVGVTPVNDAPSGTDATLTLVEDGSRVLTVADFGYSDVDGHSQIAVIITTLPTAGTLLFNGTPIVAGDFFILIGDIADGDLVFVPAPDGNGTGYATFTFQVVDSGSTANGGQDTDQSPNTITFDVSAVNDAPSGTDTSRTINEDGTLSFTAADFGFTDPADGHAFFSVIVTTLPANGTLTLSGNPVLAGAEIAVADIPNLLYTPAANASGTGYGTFTFQVRDNGGTPGTDTDATANTFAIDVTAVNDAPSGTDTSRTINEDATLTFTAADFGFSDPVEGHAFFSVILTTLPANGTLTLSGNPVLAGAEIAVADIPNLLYTPLPNGNGTGYGSFTFQVRDNGGTPGADTDATANTFAIDVTAVNDAPTNSVPGAQTINEDGALTLSAAFGNCIQIADVDAGAGTVTVTLSVAHGILTVAVVGGLSYVNNGTSSVIISGTVAAINNALSTALTYDPAPNYNGTDTLQILTSDDGNTGTGGALTDLDNVTINITAVNDAPTVAGDGTESAATIAEDTPGAGQTIQALFAGQYSDAADNQVPNGGASSPGQFSGVAVTANGSSPATGQWQYFSGGVWTDIGAVSDAAAKLFGDPFVTLFRFNPAADYNGPAPTLTVHLIDNSLPFGIVNGQVVDISGPGATGGTTAYSTGTVVLSQDVTAVNDAPVNSVPGTQTINEDASVILSTGNGNALSVADVDATTLTVTLTVQHGTLTLASTAGLSFGAGDGTADLTMTFSGTAAAVNAALGSGLTYNPNANFNGSDAISMTTSDGGQTGTGGTLQDSDSVTINITAINDAPVVIGDGTESAATINEDTPGAGQTIQALFAGQYSDAADNQVPNGGASSPGQFSGVAVTANGSSPATGQWQYFSGGVWTDIGAVSDAAAKLFGDPFVTLFRFNPAADYNGPAPTLTVHLIDNSLPFGIVNGQVVDISGPGATGGTTAYSTGIVVLSQDVTAVNDAPVNSVPGSQTINEDGTLTFSSGNGNMISVADVDAGGGTITTTLDIASGALFPLPTGPGGPTVTGAGTNHVVISGTVAQVNGVLNTLIYQPAANANGAFTLSISTTDNGNSGSGGALIDNDTININVSSVNDAPQGTDKTISSSEDDPYPLTAADFGFSDPNDVPVNGFAGVVITVLPTNGTLTNNGGAVSVGDFVTIANINAGLLIFIADPDEFGTGYASFTFQVRDNGGAPGSRHRPERQHDDDRHRAGQFRAGGGSERRRRRGGRPPSSRTAPRRRSARRHCFRSRFRRRHDHGAMITITDAVAGDALSTLTGALPGSIAVTTPSAGRPPILTGPATGGLSAALVQDRLYEQQRRSDARRHRPDAHDHGDRQ